MANSITTHVVVEFGATDASPNVILEVDSREDGYNGGKTSFQPGDAAYLLLFEPDGWSESYRAVSAGSISYVGETVVDKEDFLTFIDDETASLQYPLFGTPTFTWLGANLGVVSVANGVCSLPPRTYDPVDGFSPAHRVGIARVNYKAKAKVYSISSVPVAVSKVAALFVVSKD